MNFFQMIITNILHTRVVVDVKVKNQNILQKEYLKIKIVRKTIMQKEILFLNKNKKEKYFKERYNQCLSNQ